MTSSPKFLVLIAAVAFLTTTVRAEVRVVSREDALETDSASVLLPSSEGSILRRDCQGCNTVPLQITHESKFFVLKKEVSLVELNAFLKQTKQTVSMVIFHKIGAPTVTRIVID